MTICNPSKMDQKMTGVRKKAVFGPSRISFSYLDRSGRESKTKQRQVEGEQKKVEWPKTLLSIENPQLLSNLNETWWKYSSHEYFMLLEFQPGWIKIVDFLLIAKFWAILLFFGSPSKYNIFKSIFWRIRLLASFNNYLGISKISIFNAESLNNTCIQQKI